MILIDGSIGEGGGQILRSALALSLVTGQAFRINNIRAGRAKPGLLRQHLTAVKAAAEIGGAEVQGDAIGSLSLEFKPGKVRPGNYGFAVGTAGSATLVLQTVLPALLTLTEPTTVAIEGGTHNPFAPPFDFLERTFLPQLARMGARVEAKLERHGFFPAGGGKLIVNVEPVARLNRLEIPEHFEVRAQRARALVAHLELDIAERELSVVGQKLGWARECLIVEKVRNSSGPGNILLLEIESEHVTEIVTGFGEKGRSAEAVAVQAIEQARKYITNGVAVGEHLADQLILPMAIGAGGSFLTGELSRHTTTNMEVIQRFLPDVSISAEKRTSHKHRVTVKN